MRRRIVSKEEYDALSYSRYYLEKQLYGTREDNILEKRCDVCNRAFETLIRDRRLSLQDDIYVLFSYNCKKIVCANYGYGLQLVAEELAHTLLLRDEWSDFAVELSGEWNEDMILGGEIELVTRDEIIVRLPSIETESDGSSSP